MSTKASMIGERFMLNTCFPWGSLGFGCEPGIRDQPPVEALAAESPRTPLVPTFFTRADAPPE